MNSLQTINTSPENNFIVTRKDINNSNALLSNVLYKKMEFFVKSIISEKFDISNPIPKLMKLQILRNAYLKDRLHINSQIKTLNESELHMLVVVMNKNNSVQNIICKAIFKFPIDQKVTKAS